MNKIVDAYINVLQKFSRLLCNLSKKIDEHCIKLCVKQIKRVKDKIIAMWGSDYIEVAPGVTCQLRDYIELFKSCEQCSNKESCNKTIYDRMSRIVYNHYDVSYDCYKEENNGQ